MNQSNTCVPAFLVKLWALVEDSTTNDVITWSGNGQNFRVLNEHKFAKEILPLYFKHSNMSSFVRQLNMYGFRKVVSLEGGLIRHAEDSMEFHHPFFIQGQEKLLENIKRKVSSVRMEETNISPSELHDVLLDVQQMKGKQDNVDAKLAALKRENQVLWQEVASLRRRHAEQQKLLNKVIQFIVGLLRTNMSLGVKRKRPLMFNVAGSRPAKQNRQCVPKNSEAAKEENRLVLNDSRDVSETGIVIQDVTNLLEKCTEEESLVIQTEGAVNNGMKLQNQVKKIPVSCEVTSKTNTPGGAKYHTQEETQMQTTTEEILPVHSTSTENQDLVLEAILNGNTTPTQNVYLMDSVLGLVQVVPACEVSHTDEAVEEKIVPSTMAAALSTAAKDSRLNSSTEGVLVPSSSAEDAGSVVDSILNENSARTNEFTLDRSEIQDFLDCIDTSIEELQTMLSGKCSNTAVVGEIQELVNNSASALNEVTSDTGSTDKQLVQYTGNPVLSFFEAADPAKELKKKEEFSSHSSLELEMSPPEVLLSDPMSLKLHNSCEEISDSYDITLLPDELNSEYALLPFLGLSSDGNMGDETAHSGIV